VVAYPSHFPRTSLHPGEYPSTGPEALTETQIAFPDRHAAEMLTPTPLPDSVVGLRKLRALADSSTVLPGRFTRPPINVTFTDGPNQVGVEQKAGRGPFRGTSRLRPYRLPVRQARHS
jgi:hypothetical protein